MYLRILSQLALHGLLFPLHYKDSHIQMRGETFPNEQCLACKVSPKIYSIYELNLVNF